MGEKVRRRWEATKGRMIRPRTVGDLSLTAKVAIRCSSFPVASLRISLRRLTFNVYEFYTLTVSPKVGSVECKQPTLSVS